MTLPIAIDPLALIFTTRLYLIYVELHHPNEPVTSAINEVLSKATLEEKAFVEARVANLNAYTNAVGEALRAQMAVAEV